MYYTSVESKLTAVSVQFINSKKLLHGAFNQSMLKQWWTQVSKNASLKDVKKRVVDHINATGLEVSLDDARLWLYNTAPTDPEMQLENRCKQVRNSYASQEKSGKATSGEAEQEKEDVEMNSGIDFPGQCLEPLLKSGLRMNQLKQNNSNIVIEFREHEDDIFAFKCNANEKLVIGVCEYCNKKNIMRAICKCKNVKYCDDDCLERDKRFHIDKCSAMADNELQQDDLGALDENSRRGLAGLANLGNTCYMNSSI